MWKLTIKTIFFIGTALVMSNMLISDDDFQELRSALVPTDLIVVGCLSDVSAGPVEWLSVHGGNRTGESGTAKLMIEEVLWGKAFPGTALEVKWNYFDDIDDLSSRNPHTEGQEGIYFLVCPSHRKISSSNFRCSIKPDEEVSMAEHVYRPIEEHEEIIGFLAKYPLRIYSDSAFVLIEPVTMILSLTNPGKEIMHLPGIAYKDKQLIHGDGFDMTVRFESLVGSNLKRKPNSIKSVSSTPQILLQPGENKSFTIGLNDLFFIDKPGFYFTEIKIDGFPEQLIDMFMVLDNSD
jgi:hypothetical protein